MLKNRMERSRRRREEGETRKGPWTAEEDEVLINFVNDNGPRDWSSIRSKGLLPRTGKSCRLRWVNKLRPNLKKGCKFSPEEERVVLDLQATYGNRWATIASYLPGRTDNDVKNFWSTRQKRLARILGSSPSSSSSSQALKNNNNSKSSPKLSSAMDDGDEPSSFSSQSQSQQVFKSYCDEMNEEPSPSTMAMRRLCCSCFCTESLNPEYSMNNPLYSSTSTIELLNTTTLPLLMTDHTQLLQPNCSYSPLFALPPPPPPPTITAAISSSSLHFPLNHHHHHQEQEQEQKYPNSFDFPQFLEQESRDDHEASSYFTTMEVGEPISAMDDVVACHPPDALQIVNSSIPEIGGIVVDDDDDQSISTQNWERSEKEKDKMITVPDNVFNDLPSDLFEFLDKTP